MSDPIILNTLEWDSHVETEQWWGSWQEGFAWSPNCMVPTSTEGQPLCVSLSFLVPLVGAKQTFQLEWVWSELKPFQNLFCFLPEFGGGGGQICLFFTKLAGTTTRIWTHKDNPRTLGRVGTRRRPGRGWGSEWIQAKVSPNGTWFIFNLSLFTRERKIKVC